MPLVSMSAHESTPKQLSELTDWPAAGAAFGVTDLVVAS